MQNEPQQQTPSMMQDMQKAQQWTLFVLRSVAVTLEVFLRAGFGRRYLGVQALAGLALTLTWACGQRTHDNRAMLGFIGAFLVMLVWARLGIGWRYLRGDRESTLYTGRPRLWRLFRFMGEVRVKQVVEPLVGVGLGFALMRADTLLSLWLIAAGVSIAIHTTLIEATRRRRLDDLQDAMLDQRQIGEAFQQRR